MLNKIFNISALILILCFPFFNSAEAEDNDCVVKFSTLNICDAARQIQAEMAPNLPMQLSQNLFLTKVTSFGPQLNLYANLRYDEKYFEDALAAQGASRAAVDSHMRLMAKNKVCSNSTTEAFMGLGGKIGFDYSFIDGTTYLEFVVDIASC